jgi:hypothetical protein
LKAGFTGLPHLLDTLDNKRTVASPDRANRFTKNRFVPILEQVAIASMTAVAAYGMAGQQSPHHAGDGGIASL